jgi:hypothetical protein
MIPEDASIVTVSFNRAYTMIPELLAERVNFIKNEFANDAIFLFIGYEFAKGQYDIRFTYGVVEGTDPGRMHLEHGQLIPNRPDRPAMVMMEYDAEVVLYENHFADVGRMIETLRLNPMAIPDIE